MADVKAGMFSDASRDKYVTETDIVRSKREEWSEGIRTDRHPDIILSLSRPQSHEIDSPSTTITVEATECGRIQLTFEFKSTFWGYVSYYCRIGEDREKSYLIEPDFFLRSTLLMVPWRIHLQ